jgi:hypothetical protein
VREIVIVIADLYLPPPTVETAVLPQNGAGLLPALEHASRFGTRSALQGGWRDWLARWLGREDLVGVPPAVVAARAMKQLPSAAASSAWIATPVNMIAGLTTVHVDHRSILRPALPELEHFATDFEKVFSDSGFSLQALPSGDFLMRGPSMPDIVTHEPARWVLTGVAESLPSGAGAATLRRLGAEIEMWLHEHPLNATRVRRGEAPVTALWVWGGGEAVASVRPSSRAETGGPEASGHTRAGSPQAFGSDPFLAGLWQLDTETHPASAAQLRDIFSYPPARRAAALTGRVVVVTELVEMLHSNPRWTVLDALAEIDRRWVAPALQALGQHEVDRVIILANDRQVTVRAADRWKLWRRAQPGLIGLQ